MGDYYETVSSDPRLSVVSALEIDLLDTGTNPETHKAIRYRLERELPQALEAIQIAKVILPYWKDTSTMDRDSIAVIENLLENIYREL
jgi:hypothetical protein